MYKVDLKGKRLTKLEPKKFQEIGIKERFDVEEWIEKSPEFLGEELLIIYKELPLPSRIRLDLLAIDKSASLVIIELKRDDSGSDIEWQAIKYASYCSNFLPDYIFTLLAEYSNTSSDEAREKIEAFIDVDIEKLNQEQRIILVAKEFHSDVMSAVFWLRDYEIDLKCIRLRRYIDNDNLFLDPEVIVPLPEAADYLTKREVKQKEFKRSSRPMFSLEKGNFKLPELRERLISTLNRPSELTPRFNTLLEILLSEKRVFEREELKKGLFEKGIGEDIGQAGRYLSNLSQFLTKPSNPHLRQVISFESGGLHGETKDNYEVVAKYWDLLTEVFKEWKKKHK